MIHLEKLCLVQFELRFVIVTLWNEVSAAVFFIAEHADDVHDQLQQLSVETLLLLQRCTIRVKLQ